MVQLRTLKKTRRRERAAVTTELKVQRVSLLEVKSRIQALIDTIDHVLVRP